MSYKSDFPLFGHYPHISYLDSASTMQKPAYVIDAVSHFVSHDYANIHRWAYELAERAEDAYEHSKQLLAELVGTQASQIAYVSNATMGFNMIAQLFVTNGLLKSWDEILMPISEHHATIVPFQMVAQQYDLTIRFVDLDQDYRLDMDDLMAKYTSQVKLVVCGHISNVTGSIVDLEALKAVLRDDTMLVVDASQSIQHMPLRFDKLGLDAAVMTWHKMMAYTGIGAVIFHPKYKNLTPVWWGGGIIEDVTTSDHRFVSGMSAMEPWTPDIIGAVSLWAAVHYINQIGGYEAMQQHDKPLIDYTLERFAHYADQIQLIGSTGSDNRAWVFSFVIQDHPQHARWADRFAQHDICVRAGGHCTHPFRHHLGILGSIRMSLGLYNDIQDIDRMFECIQEGIAFRSR